jgi:hypothetical protein
VQELELLVGLVHSGRWLRVSRSPISMLRDSLR